MVPVHNLAVFHANNAVAPRPNLLVMRHDDDGLFVCLIDMLH